MLTPGMLSWEIAEYSVLVLPLPVGPVTSTMPHGFLMAASNRYQRVWVKASFVMSSCSLPESSNRMTTFSPNSVGRHDTRKSISRTLLPSLKRALMRPSCGSRFSAMSSRAMILMREMIGSRYLSAGAITACSTPSMRNRIRMSFS